MDYKGEFRLGNRTYCYPLTVTDHFSRFLTGCESQENTRTEGAQRSLLDIFADHGLPDAIRSDNGAPFASTGRMGLSRLSVLLMRLGIELERIEPGHPEQNGRHERFHLTLKQDTTSPPAQTILAQQEKFDAFRRIYNHERPHEALAMKTPGDVYKPSQRRLPDELPEVSYPHHDRVTHVLKGGHCYLTNMGQIYLGTAFAHQPIGLRQTNEGPWLVSFMDLDIGYIDLELKKIINLPK